MLSKSHNPANSITEVCSAHQRRNGRCLALNAIQEALLKCIEVMLLFRQISDADGL